MVAKKSKPDELPGSDPGPVTNDPPDLKSNENEAVEQSLEDRKLTIGEENGFSERQLELMSMDHKDLLDRMGELRDDARLLCEHLDQSRSVDRTFLASGLLDIEKGLLQLARCLRG